MEFDECQSWSWRSNLGAPTNALFDKIRAKWRQNGYQMPELIFWNLDARQKQFPVEQHSTGTMLVSGFSPSALQYIFTGKFTTPYENMLKVLDHDRYAIIREILAK